MMTTGENGVAVIVAAFNAEATIGRALRSALAEQRVAEIIVVDDASRDDTADAARRADDGSGRLTITTLPDNAGPARARNIAINSTRSAYVCVLDADDYLLPGRLERLFRAGAGEHWDILADDIVIVPEELEQAEFSLVGSDTAGSGISLDLSSFVRGNISQSGSSRGELGFLKPVLSRKFLREHNLRYEEGMRLGEDYALYVRALIAGARFRVVDACGYVAVERRDSISSRHTAVDLKRIADFDARCLASETGLSEMQRRALAAHHWSILSKHRYREVLDCKKERGFLPALGMLASAPQFLPYIASETMQAKLAERRAARAPRNANCGPRRIRLLLGLPHARLSLREGVAAYAQAGGGKAALAP